MLLHNNRATLNEAVVERFIKLTSSLNFNQTGAEGLSNYHAVFDAVREEMLTLPYTEQEIVDALVIYLFSEKRNSKKRAFWTIYGDVVYQNLRRNIDENSVICPTCGQRFIKTRKDQTYCCTACRQVTKKKRSFCIDCGKEISTKGKANRKVRCDACAKKRKAELQHIRYMAKKLSTS